MSIDDQYDVDLNVTAQQRRDTAFRRPNFPAFAGFVGLVVALAAAAAVAYDNFAESEVRIGNDVRERLACSTFLVESGAKPIATAWPAGPRALATAGHVVEFAAELPPSDKAMVRGPGRNGKTFEVSDYKIHPGYRAFNALLAEDVARRDAAQVSLGYDVGLLYVSEDLPAECRLDLATAAELRSLVSGTVVATAGYPIAGVASGSAQTYGATPELHIGTVSGLTDFFFLPAPFAHRLLIHHSLPVTGGVSGSPIVGSSGRVVGLLNSGNFTGNQGGRFASAALVNYAQRADLIGHLLAQDNDISSVDRKYWSEQIANFPAGPDLVAKSIVRELRNSDKGRRIDFVRMSEQVARLTESVAGSLTDSADQRSVRHLVSVAGGSDYVILCYAFDGSNLQLHAFAGEQLVASSKGGTYYPWIRYQPSKDTTLTILVLGPKDRDVKYNIQVGKLQSNGPSG